MKDTFANLPQEKKSRVIQACLKEFAAYSYKKSSLDRIIKNAGISKGGLYEYISTKEELYLFAVDFSYSGLYGYIRLKLKEQKVSLPDDMVDRIYLISKTAIDYYLDHPECVALIVNTYKIDDALLYEKIQQIFNKHFLDIFGDIEQDRLVTSRSRILDLFSWLLLKSRQDFLRDLKSEKNRENLRKNYMENWDFLLQVLKQGIYSIKD